MGPVKKAEGGLYKVESEPPPDGEDAYDAPTKVGAMAPAAIAKLMLEAEQQGVALPGGPPSKAAPAPAPVPRPAATDVTPNMPQSGLRRSSETGGASVIDSIVEEMASSLLQEDDGRKGVRAPPAPPPALPTPVGQFAPSAPPATAAKPTTPPQAPGVSTSSAPRAAYPEWLGVTVHHDDIEKKKGERTRRMAVAAVAFVVATSFALWWLFRS